VSNNTPIQYDYDKAREDLKKEFRGSNTFIIVRSI